MEFSMYVLGKKQIFISYCSEPTLQVFIMIFLYVVEQIKGYNFLI